MGVHDWSITMSQGELSAEFRWREFIDSEGNAIGYFASVEPLSESAKEAAHKHPGLQAVEQAARSYRQFQLRQEFQKDIRSLITTEGRKRFILELFERAQEGVYLGQPSNQSYFYVQTIAKLMAWDFGSTRDLVDELVAEGRVGLTGMILIPFEEQEDTFERTGKATGHGRITIGDWGNWYCSACGQSGDEMDNPRDFPCEPKAASAEKSSSSES